MSDHTFGANDVRPRARFETKPGEGSGAGYERWRSWEYRPDTAGDSKEDVFVAHHRLLSVIACYPLEQPIESVLDDLDGKDVHHVNGCKWDNRHENIEPVEHARHAEITQQERRAWAEDQKRERERSEEGFEPEPTCAGCGEPAETLATSPGFDGERCIECATAAADGEPIQL